MEERKWEDLGLDCLVNVFERVGMESLLLSVPFVCKSWYKATLSPLCWRTHVFPEELDTFISRLIDEYRLKKLDLTELVKFVVNHGDKSTVSLVVPSRCSQEAMDYAADGCPALKYLELRYSHAAFLLRTFHGFHIFTGLICKWQNLEIIKFGSPEICQETLNQISLNCKNFVGLCLLGACVGEEDALAIVTFLPNIKHLELRYGLLPWESLVFILKGCEKLVHLDVRGNVGFRVDDEILELASHIPIFKYGR